MERGRFEDDMSEDADKLVVKPSINPFFRVTSKVVNKGTRR
jgi:hypothetical protein